MKFTFTQHAVERFASRCAPSLPPETAYSLLEQKASSAVPLREKTVSGQTQWIVPDLGCVLVTKYDNKETVVVTVLKDDRFVDLNELLNPQKLESLETMLEVDDASADCKQVRDELYSFARSTEQFINESPGNKIAYDLARKKSQKLARLGERLEGKIPELLTAVEESGSLKKVKLRLFETEQKHITATNALRLAVRALFGELSAYEALEAIAMLDMEFIDESFYQRAKTLRELAENEGRK